MRFLGTAAASLCVLLTAQAQPHSSAEAPNVILITIDTLRADYVSSYGSDTVQTPALDSLAADGVLFENAYCQTPLTPPSHASIFTGKYPPTHGLRDFTSGRLQKHGKHSMAALLKERGYQTAAFVSALVLDRTWGLDEGFDVYDDHFDVRERDGVHPGNIQRRAEETVDRALQWLASAKAPYFLWVHLFDPHHDYDPPAPFRQRHSANLYAGEVAYVDSQIHRLLEAMRTSGQYSDSLIVAVSDHGESLGEHGEDEHGFFLYESVLRVPLIMKMPEGFGVRRQRESLLAETVDILPSVLQVLRIPQDSAWGIEGKGLLSAVLRKRFESRFVYAETLYPLATFGWSELKAYREGRYKYIDAPRPELYDLETDPGESENIYSANQALALQLKQKLAALEENFRAAETSPASEASAETIQRLSALGYVSLGRPVPVRDSGHLADPKDKIQVYNAFLKGMSAAEAGRVAESDRILNELARAEPDLFIVHYSLGMNHLKAGKPADALQAFQTARSLNPEFLSIDLHSAQALAALGRAEEAISTLEMVLRKDPRHLAAQRLLATQYARTSRLAEAIQIYREILDLRRDDRPAIRLLGMALVENGNFGEGLETLRRAAQLGPSDAAVLNSQGIALANLGQLEAAINAYREAIRVNAEHAQSRLNLALTLSRVGKREEAVEQFRALCRINAPLCERYRDRF